MSGFEEWADLGLKTAALGALLVGAPAAAAVGAKAGLVITAGIAGALVGGAIGRVGAWEALSQHWYSPLYSVFLSFHFEDHRYCIMRFAPTNLEA